MVDLVKQLREPVSGESSQIMVQWAADEIEQLKAQLWKYGKHLSACAAWKNMADGCTCGWATVRSTLAPEKQTVNDAFNAAIAPQADGGSEHGA